jgi:hypothetical protein
MYVSGYHISLLEQGLLYPRRLILDVEGVVGLMAFIFAD